MLLADLIEEYYRTHMGLQDLSAPTLKTYRVHVRRYARWIGPSACVADVTSDGVQQFVNTLPLPSRRVINASLKSFFGYLCHTGRLASNPALGVVLPRHARKRREPVPDDIVEKLCEAANHISGAPWERIQARAIMQVLKHCAMRRKQILSLTPASIDLKQNAIRFFNSKSRKDQKIYPNQECMIALRAWLHERECFVNEPTEYTLKCARAEGLFIANRTHDLGMNGLSHLLGRIKATAGFKNMPITIHQFRHACASRLSKNGASIVAIQHFLGHSQMATTAIYVHTDDEMRRLAELTNIKPASASAAARPAPEKVKQPAPKLHRIAVRKNPVRDNGRRRIALR